MSSQQRLLMLVLLWAGVAFAQQVPELSRADKMRVEETLKKVVVSALERQAGKWQLPEESFDAKVEVSFDDDALLSDFNQYQSESESRRRDIEQQYGESIIELLKEIEQKQQTAAKSEDSAKASNAKAGDAKLKVRFGDLNVDVDPSEFDFVVPQAEEGSAEVVVTGPGLSMTIPAPELSVNPFRFQAEDYIKKVDVAITVPMESPEGAEDVVKKRLREELSLSSFKGNTSDWVQVARSEEPWKTQSLMSKVFDYFFSAQNSFLGLIFSSLILALVAFFGSLTLAGGFKRIAASISELKPEPVAEQAPTEAKEAEPEEKASKDDESDGPVAERSSGATASDAARAMTASMSHLRGELASAAEQNPPVFAEILSDLFYDPQGMVSLRELLTFIGFQPLKAALRALPESKVTDLKSFVQDRQDIEGDIFAGIEMAQQILREFITRLSTGEEVSEALLQTKARLLSIDDDLLGSVAADMTGDEAALVLRVVTKARSNWLVKQFSPEILQEAVKIFDDVVERAADIYPLLHERLEKATGETAGPKISKDRMAFVLRLVRGCGLNEEGTISELVDQDDWQVRVEMMLAKFFYKDIQFVPKKILKAVFSEIKLKKRAEFIALSEGDTRQHLLSVYPKDGRMREMLDSELGLIENNPRRKKDLEKRRVDVVDEFMGNLRRAIGQDRTILADVIDAQCKALSLEPPADILESLNAA